MSENKQRKLSKKQRMPNNKLYVSPISFLDRQPYSQACNIPLLC